MSVPCLDSCITTRSVSEGSNSPNPPTLADASGYDSRFCNRLETFDSAHCPSPDSNAADSRSRSAAARVASGSSGLFDERALPEAFASVGPEAAGGDRGLTVAATDEVFMEFSCNGRPMGSEFELNETPHLKIVVHGTASIERITIVSAEYAFTSK